VAASVGRVPPPGVAHIYCMHLGLSNDQHVLHHRICRLKHEELLLLEWIPRPPPLTRPRAKAKPKAKAKVGAKAKADTLNPKHLSS
jgi:hypothetical protein